ncbi:MAG: ribosome-binding factor A [Chloroflexi bacterium]|nr:ribosome-binding factor A [Chloroflexota bacterium]HCU73094.1 30S ribosome-binding factor RbfA [Chloroflexota bacterium]
MAARRAQRIEAQIAREISDVLERRLTDPSIGFVTVQRVAITPDLSRAIVFVAPLGQAEQAQVTLQSLQRAAAFVRRELSQRIRMYRIPEIRFQLDPDMVTEESIAQRALGSRVTENTEDNSIDVDDWQG